MRSKANFQLGVALLGALLLALFAFARPPAFAERSSARLKDPCALDPNNLVYNGSMRPGHDTPYGSVADGWEPFIFNGAPPRFRWVDNEQIDPYGAQQIFASHTFDAGIQQTVRNLQPGVYYWFRLGYSLAAKSWGGPNVRVDTIGRKIGVDPTGGTDPKSPNVIWGPDLFDSVVALNRPEMTMVFAARAERATFFLRAMARDGSGGENRVWLDAVCMEARPEMPTATPLPPTVTPTAPPRPTQTRIPPTLRQAQGETKTPAFTRTPTATPTATNTPTPIPTATATSLPRRARPVVTPPPEPPLALDAGVLTGFGVSSLFGALLFFGMGIVLLRH